MLLRILIVSLLGLLLPVLSVASPELVSVSPRDGILRTVDAADGSTLESSIVLSLNGQIVLGAMVSALKNRSAAQPPPA